MHLLRTFPKQIIFLALVLILGLGYLSFHTRGPGCAVLVSGSEFRPRSCVSLERAETPEAREKGLSGRASMDKANGMLFVFDKPQQVCIWMKDMKFPLDIVWLNSGKRIAEIKHNVSPDTYPESFCVDNAQYVVELNAGVVDQAGLRPGQQLKI